MVRKYNTNSWKQKIDPAFHKLVKIYAHFLTQLEANPDEGRLTFPSDFIEPIIEKSGWHESYRFEGSEGDFLQFSKQSNLISGKVFDTLNKLVASLEEKEALLKLCNGMVKVIPETESRAFYTHELARLKTFSKSPDFRLTDDLSNKDIRDFYSIVFSLLLRYLFVEFFEKKNINGGEEGLDYFKDSTAITTFIGYIYYTFSQLSNQITLTELISKIDLGDDKALFKAVKIDKSLLFRESVKDRILKAQLSGDAKFFDKLGKAVSDSPLKRIGQHGKTYAVLKLFWFAGLYKLNSSELYDFLKSCGLIPPLHPYAFEKFLERYIYPSYKP